MVKTKSSSCFRSVTRMTTEPTINATASNGQLPDPEYDRKFNSRSTTVEVLKDLDLSDKTFLITGTTSGIGIETARSLAIRGAHVVMANRSILKSEAIRDSIYNDTEHRKIDLIHMDLSSLQSVQATANEFLGKGWPLHVLVLNAGGMAIQPPVSIDNYNNTFQTNHLGHFYLTHLLRSKLIESAPSRVVIVSSNSHKHTLIRANSPLNLKMEKLIQPSTSRAPAYLQYAMSKLCNVLFAFKLHRELNSQGVSVFVLHPGSMIPTSIGRNYGVFNKISNVLFKPFTKTLEQGAATTVYCAATPGLEKESGRYFENCFDDQKSLQQTLACDESFQDELWNKCKEMVDTFENSQPS